MNDRDSKVALIFFEKFVRYYSNIVWPSLKDPRNYTIFNHTASLAYLWFFCSVQGGRDTGRGSSTFPVSIGTVRLRGVSRPRPITSTYIV